MLLLTSFNERIWDEGVPEHFAEETVETQEGKKHRGTTENFTLMYFVISPFRQVLLGVSKSIEIRQERRERSRDEVFIGNIGQETYNDEITYRRRRRSRVTVNLKK
jgi:hypothetical protein